MKSSELNTPVTIYEKSGLPDEHFQRSNYILKGEDWANFRYLETIKDNETETAKSHDSAFAIARLTLRYNPEYIRITSTDLFVVYDELYEVVGMPLQNVMEGTVFVNVKIRDDIGELLNL
jgi:hypothetical protein